MAGTLVFTNFSLVRLVGGRSQVTATRGSQSLEDALEAGFPGGQGECLSEFYAALR